MVNRYDTFENWDVIMYLQKKFGLRKPMHPDNVRRYAPEFKKFVESVVPQDQLVCLKFVWYYEPLFRAAFPHADYYFVSRREFPVIDTKKKAERFREYKKNMTDGTWIDTERLIENPPDLRQIQHVIGQHSALKWDSQAVDALYASNGSEKYQNTRRIIR